MVEDCAQVSRAPRSDGQRLAYSDGQAGVEERVALLQALGEKAARSPRWHDLAYKVIQDARTAEDATARIEAFLRSLPYRGEPGEVYRDPMLVAQGGGDCDDLCLLGYGLFRSLGIPVAYEVLSLRKPGDDDVRPFHIRLRVGKPADEDDRSASGWQVVDPVEQSEAEWLGIGQDGKPVNERSMLPYLFVAVGAVVAWEVLRGA